MEIQRVEKKKNSKKFVWNKVSNVGPETETMAMLTPIPSCDEDFMRELKVKYMYKVKI